MSSEEFEDCLICAYPIDYVTRLPAFGVCNHDGVCSICILRMRTLQHNNNCLQCKNSLEHVICAPTRGLKWSDFNVWGESIGPDFMLDYKANMFFPKDYYKAHVEKLWSCKCIICNTNKRDVKALRGHLSGDHNMQMCMLCIENRHSFPSEMRVYNQSDVRFFLSFSNHARTCYFNQFHFII